MPILVKDFTWTQTETTVHILVPLKPVAHEKVDLFSTDSYIKANYSPFLFEVFLLHNVDNNKSKCIVQEDVIIIDLIKREQVEWTCLEKELSNSQKLALKQEILTKCQEEAKKEAEEKHIQKTQMDRFAVQRAMDIDNKQHDLINSRRDAQRKKAMDELEEWRVAKAKQSPNKFIGTNGRYRNSTKIIELPSSDEETEATKNIHPKCMDSVGPNNILKNNSANQPALQDEANNKPIVEINKKSEVTKPKAYATPISQRKKTPVKSEYVEKKKTESKSRVLPKMRECGEVEISHTPRTFPTPSRESTANEEEIWLKNMTLARRATGFVSEDLRPEEQDPQWCKEKGDEFFRNGNFLGAISAYSHGITLSDKLPSLYANRAATHFALGNFNKCLNDCSDALDLMKPECEGNRKSRAKCIARRAAALARIGYLNKAINEMKAAAKLLPDDEKIRKDVYDMERAWEQNPDSD